MSEEQSIYTATTSIPVTIAPVVPSPTPEAQLDDKTRRALVRYFVTMKKAAETMLNELER